MPTEIYNGLTWEVDTIPIGSSTPDEFFELDYRAYANCENGHRIEGVAHYWSRDENFINSWLDSISYEECEECGDEDDSEMEDYDDED